MKNPYSVFGSDIGICVVQSQRTFENQDLITEVKNISALISNSKYILNIGENPRKARLWLASVICFDTLNG